jgi:hypothetical protein
VTHPLSVDPAQVNQSTSGEVLRRIMSDENLRNKIKETNESKNIHERRESMNHVQNQDRCWSKL